ncbi:MAG: T9SS type A sorting domain-containing protein [Bacteroidia bacterium]
MKKLYTLALALGIAGMANAQKISNTLPLNSRLDRTTTGERTPTDTLGLDAFFQGSPTLNGSQGGGYVVGNNAYDDKQKAQVYLLTEGTLVEEILFWFGAKENTSGNASSKVVAKVYAADGPGTTDAGPITTGAPGSVLASVDVFISDIDTAGNYTVAALPSPLYVGGDFAVGFDVTTIASGDTVGCVATADGDAGQTELSWEQWDDNSWHTMFQAWPLDIDFAIWPVVDNSSASIDDEGFFDGIKLGQSQPNPAGAETTIQYELQNNANVTFEMYDVTGKKVISMNEGAQNKGKHTLNLTTEKLASGTYYYSLKADNNRITKKLVVAK